MTDYRVIAPVVVAPGDTSHGRALAYFYTNTLLPQGVPSATIRHLLRRNMIEAVGGGHVEQQEPTAEQGGESGGSGAPDSTPYDDPERVAAREKLPADGSLPDGRAAHAVWVEAAVARGYAFDAAVKSSKKELQDLLSK